MREKLVRRGASFLSVGAMAVAVACSSNGGDPRSGSPAASPPAPPGFVTLARSAHPLARPELDVGRLEPSRVLHNLSLVFRPSAA